MKDLHKIELLVLDVDGVLTDGRIVLTPSGEEIKAFHVRDGSGMKYWKRCGKKLAIISGRASHAVTIRAGELDVDAVRLGAKDKLPAFEDILKEMGLAASQAAVIGDDLPDLPMILRAGLAVATADAVEEVRSAAGYVTSLPGGCGCVRETIEMILKNTGRWQGVLERYLSGEGKRPS